VLFFFRAAFSFSFSSELLPMNRIALLAGVLAATGLTGCIMLPPPPMPYRPPPPGFRGEGPPPMFYGARRPPPPGWAACDAYRGVQGGCARGMPGEPDIQQAPGAR
jgi:hypothetical protein